MLQKCSAPKPRPVQRRCSSEPSKSLCLEPYVDLPKPWNVRSFQIYTVFPTESSRQPFFGQKLRGSFYGGGIFFAKGYEFLVVSLGEGVRMVGVGLGQANSRRVNVHAFVKTTLWQTTL